MEFNTAIGLGNYLTLAAILF
ncbi:MAG: NADH-quinone oxidoreductase subunit K, partial [PS1 clade bacterium]